MKIALVGFSNSGKTTIFNAMTEQKIETSPAITQPELSHKGVLQVEDNRLKQISALIKPKKTTFATIECLDAAGFLKNNTVHNVRVLKEITDVDALIYVLRGFNNPSIPYQFDSIDPLRDFNELEYELLMVDLELVTKRIERMDEQNKKGQKINIREREVLDFFKEYLENGKALRNIDIKQEQLIEVRHLSFITLKPLLAIINVDEQTFKDIKFQEMEFLKICGSLESELVQLPEEERWKFLEAMGIDEPVSKKITRKVYEVLNYISFFTVGPQEVRAWSIKKGTKAWEAAGKIHSDIQRGFIRAEVLSYDDFISAEGDINIAKQRGVFRLEGKEYEVKDGDIITFRFKV